MRFFWLLSLMVLPVMSCVNDGQGENPPQGHAYFPTEILQSDSVLYVLSNNFDRRYLSGSVMSINLDVVDTELNASKQIIDESAVSSSGFVPTFSSGIQLSPGKDFLFYVTRDDRTLRKIPLDATGRLVCENATNLGQDCLSLPSILSLPQSDPYFLRLFSSGSNSLSGGVIGYLTEPKALMADESGNFSIPAEFEYQRFTWNNGQASVEATEQVFFGASLGKILAPSIAAASNNRINSLISSFEELGEDFYVLVAHPASQTAIYLVRVSKSELRSGFPSSLIVSPFELTSSSKILTLGALAVRELGDNIEVFVTSEAPGAVVKLTMPKISNTDAEGKLKLEMVASEFACAQPTDLELTPNGKFLLMACDDGKIMIYDPMSLRAIYRDPDFAGSFGRGTYHIHFDTRIQTEPFRLYATNFKDGSISIFQVSEAADSLLTRVGHIFQPAPQNRIGGAK